MAKETRKISSFNLFLIIQLVIMLLLSLVVSVAISQKTQESSSMNMATLTRERSQIIKNYVEYAEKTLSAYSHADQIINVVSNSSDPSALQEAQNYTERFSTDIKNLEGIYVSTWDTKVLAHTNPETRGLITRKETYSLDALHNSLTEAGTAVYDAGIIISPASNKQIISMYKTIYDDNGYKKGIVGLGLYTDNLVKTLDDLAKSSNESFKYNMINVHDNTYIFSNEAELVNEVGESVSKRVENADIINNICNKIKDRTIPKNSIGEIPTRLSDGNYISTYYYMNEPYMNEDGWVFIISQSQKEYYSLTRTLIVYLAVFVLFCVIIAVVFSSINKKQEETTRRLTSAVKKNAKTKESLNTALFNDILTDVNNRVSFSTDFSDGKVKDAPDFPYYFALFNISGFSDFNINYGNEVGDKMLVNTAAILRNSFPEGTVYRTGSDEFVVAVQAQNTPSGFNQVQKCMKSALNLLSSSFNVGTGTVIVPYKTALVKKSRNINAGVITTLKDISNRNGVTDKDQINFADLDTM